MSGTYRTWRAEEVVKLRVHARLGIVALRRELPGRSTRSIYHRARRDGIVIGGSPKGDPLAKRWRGRLPIPASAHPFVRRIFAEANRQRATLAEIADRAGVCRHLISDWGHKSEPRINDLQAVLNVLGLDLVITNRKEASE